MEKEEQDEKGSDTMAEKLAAEGIEDPSRGSDGL